MHDETPHPRLLVNGSTSSTSDSRRIVQSLRRAALRAIRGPELLSFDVAAGVLGGALFLSSLAGVTSRVEPDIYAALVLAVVVVYNLDHIWDTATHSPTATARRRLYHGHRKLMALAAAVALALGVLSALELPSEVWIYGAIVGAFQGLYFVLLHRGMRGVPKRIMAAIGWSIGIAVPAWSRIGDHPHRPLAFGISLLALLAWINLQSYALIEDESERRGSAHPPSQGLRILSTGLTFTALAFAQAYCPEFAGHWLAMGGVALVQIYLDVLPSELVHACGEWSFALLGLFALLA